MKGVAEYVLLVVYVHKMFTHYLVPILKNSNNL